VIALPKTASAFLLALLAGCATQSSTVNGPIPRNVTVTVISNREMDEHDDHEIQNLIIGELRQRGYQTSDGGDGREVSHPNGTTCYHDDRWAWDMAMYLVELRLQLANGRSGQIYATSRYYDGLLHGYASSRGIVQRMFKDLDARGAFR